MEEKYLYPAFPIPHIGGGNDYVEYMLSAVLGSWGYVIRHINRDLSLFAYAGKLSCRGAGPAAIWARPR